MKKATKPSPLSIVPVFEETLSRAKSPALPVIAWNDDQNFRKGQGRGAGAVHKHDLLIAFEIACEQIRTLEAQLVAVAKAARSHMR